MRILRDVLGVPAAPGLHVNYAYLLAWAQAAGPGARILDFGCGDGLTVREGRRRGLDLQGADAFYGGSRAREQVRDLLGTAIHEIVDGRLPFAAGSFDLIVSNQVFEHVEALGPALDELARVLKPDGLLLALFPTAEVVREAHCGVPFLHWRKDGRVEHALRWQRWGNGFDKDKKPPEQWAREAVDWMERYVHYRGRVDVLREWRRRFDLLPIEEHYLAYRLGTSKLAPLLRIPWLRAAGRWICRRFNGLVVAARRRPL